MGRITLRGADDPFKNGLAFDRSKSCLQSDINLTTRESIHPLPSTTRTRRLIKVKWTSTPICWNIKIVVGWCLRVGKRNSNNLMIHSRLDLLQWRSTRGEKIKIRINFIFNSWHFDFASLSLRRASKSEFSSPSRRRRKKIFGNENFSRKQTKLIQRDSDLW